MRRSEFDRTVSRPGAPSNKTDYKSRRKMKCLISVGLVLPALAAVIGVVAWAVSADIVMGHERDNVASSNNRLQEESLEDPILQERSDNIYDGKLPVGGRVNQMQLLANDHMESSSTTKSEINSPSYIMVMSEEKSSTTAAPSKSTTAPPIAVTDMNDFLSRIISASRESGNKIFVVPIPGPLSNEQKEDTNKISTSKFYVEEDDDETTTIEEEEEMTTPKKPETISKTSRPQTGPKRSSDTYGDQGVRSYYPANNNGGNFAPPPHQQQPPQQHQQKVQIQQQHVNPPKSYYNQPMQSQHQAQPQFPSPRPQLHHSHPPPSQKFAPPPPPHLRPHHPPPNFDQNQGYIPKPAQQQPVPYFHQPEAPPPPPAPVHKPNRDAQGYDSNRWGSVEDGGYGHVQEAPKGITITFGSNHGHGGYGGDYHSHGHHVEPFSMIKSLFLPFLPKPKVNLNGRVVFGVVLEKGVGLGGNKGGGGGGAVSLGGYH